MEGVMRPVDFTKVKELVSIKQVCDLLGWRAVCKEPSAQRGPCPVHRSTDPESRSFAVNSEGWFCHSCKRGGDQIRLYAEVHRLPVLEAAIELCKAFAVDVPYLPRRPRQQRKPREQEEDR
jgi:DNA primase